MQTIEYYDKIKAEVDRMDQLAKEAGNLRDALGQRWCKSYGRSQRFLRWRLRKVEARVRLRFQRRLTKRLALDVMAWSLLSTAEPLERVMRRYRPGAWLPIQWLTEPYEAPCQSCNKDGKGDGSCRACERENEDCAACGGAGYCPGDCDDGWIIPAGCED